MSLQVASGSIRSYLYSRKISLTELGVRTGGRKTDLGASECVKESRNMKAPGWNRKEAMD